MATKKTTTNKKKTPLKKVVGSHSIFLDGVIETMEDKVEKTKLGLDAYLPLVKIIAGRQKYKVYLTNETPSVKVGSRIKWLCREKKMKFGNRVSYKYIYDSSLV